MYLSFSLWLLLISLTRGWVPPGLNQKIYHEVPDSHVEAPPITEQFKYDTNVGNEIHNEDHHDHKSNDNVEGIPACLSKGVARYSKIKICYITFCHKQRYLYIIFFNLKVLA